MSQRPLVRPPPRDLVLPPAPSHGVESRLADLQAQFDLLRAQVRQAQQLSSLGTAAAMIAHEVNNLLTPIVSYAQAAANSNDAELVRKALEVTIRNAQILIAMSDRVLEISAAKPARPEAVSVSEAIADAVASTCRDFAKDGITFRNSVDQSVRVLADPLQLQQVFFNLFLNAREAMAGSHTGRLLVSARRQGDRIEIEVGNSGPAIPADLLPHIFEPFQTSKSASRKGKSRCSGLGLALVRDLVHENGGTISAASEAGRGTTFTISLPAAAEEVRIGPP